jgi:hypothetical protein
VATSFPGTTLNFGNDVAVLGVKFGLTNPNYSIGGSSVGLTWTDVTSSKSSTLAFGSYPTLDTVAAAISAKPGFISTLLVSGTDTYSYVNLKTIVSTSVPGIGSPATIYLGTNSPAIGVRSTDPSASYLINATALTLYWDSSSTAILFASCPTLLSLKDAIEGVPVFSADVYFSDSYAYGALKAGFGAIGPTNTSFYFLNAVPVLSLAFNATSPTYQSSATDLTLQFMDGTTVTSSVVPFGSTLQSLVDDIKSRDGFDALISVNSPDYLYGVLRLDVSPVPVSTTSFTPAYIPAGSTIFEIVDQVPSYENDTTAFKIFRPTSPTDLTSVFTYAGYPLLSSLQTAITSVPNIKTSVLFDPTYSYGSLVPGSGVMNTTAPGNSVVLTTAPLFKIFFGMDNLRYSIDTTSLNIR